MTEATVTPSAKGRELIKTYQRAIEDREHLSSELRRAECAEHNARNELGKWMAPKDAKQGEKFGIWDRDQHGNDCLVEVTMPDSHGQDYLVTLRYRK